MRFIRWVAVLAMVAIGIGAAWIGMGGTAAGGVVDTTLLTSTATTTTISESIAATGSVEAAITYGLAFGADPVIASSGSSATSDREWQVTAVDVAIGDPVTAGQVLARADTADVESDLASTRADLDEARTALADAEETRASAKADTRAELATALDGVEIAKLNLKNARASYSDAVGASMRRGARITLINAKASLADAEQAVSDLREELSGDFPDETRAVTDAQATVDDLERQVADLQAELERAVLAAPVDGIVTSVAITAGYAAPAGNAVEIAGQTLQVTASVVESDLPSVAVGQAASVTIDALDLDVAGVVTQVAPSTIASSSSIVSYPVTVTLSDPHASIRSGMSADVAISVAEAADVVAVPVSALNGRSGNYSVDVMLSDGSTETRTVTVGLVTETLAEIRTGVSNGEAVVVGTSAEQTQTEDGTATDQRGMQGFPGGFSGGVPMGGPGTQP